MQTIIQNEFTVDAVDGPKRNICPDREIHVNVYSEHIVLDIVLRAFKTMHATRRVEMLVQRSHLDRSHFRFCNYSETFVRVFEIFNYEHPESAT